MPKLAVLLVNLGSPASPSVPDVRRYLREFLGDPRVIDLPAPLRWLLLEGVILPTRPKKSAHAYASVWTPQGSPLTCTSESVQRKLAAELGSDVPVYLAMRYGAPSIGFVLDQIAAQGINEILLLPQYPHYAMSSWETVVTRVYEVAARRHSTLRVDCLQPFYCDEDYIEALYAVTAPYLPTSGGHLLFSYHGIPVRHLRKADSSHAHCTRVSGCCTMSSPTHATCYRAQVLATTHAFVERAGIGPGNYSVAFQSRLAGEPWLEPATDRELRHLPATGVKNLTVLCPAFVADCLETLEEIAVAGKAIFLAAGGETFTLVPCLNDQVPYIEFLAARIGRWQRHKAQGADEAASRFFRWHGLIATSA